MIVSHRGIYPYHFKLYESLKMARKLDRFVSLFTAQCMYHKWHEGDLRSTQHHLRKNLYAIQVASQPHICCSQNSFRQTICATGRLKAKLRVSFYFEKVLDFGFTRHTPVTSTQFLVTSSHVTVHKKRRLFANRRNNLQRSQISIFICLCFFWCWFVTPKIQISFVTLIDPRISLHL